MNREIRIGYTPLGIKEYEGKRVITLNDVDRVHGRATGTARACFNRNKGRFVYGVDYFVCETYEARNKYHLTAPAGLTLLTESGYLMLVKSFTDNLAWMVQRQLVDAYFHRKTEMLPPKMELPPPPPTKVPVSTVSEAKLPESMTDLGEKEREACVALERSVAGLNLFLGYYQRHNSEQNHQMITKALTHVAEDVYSKTLILAAQKVPFVPAKW